VFTKSFKIITVLLLIIPVLFLLVMAGGEIQELPRIASRWFGEEGEKKSPVPPAPEKEQPGKSQVEEILEEEEFHLVTLYYLHQDKGFVVPLTRKIPRVEGIARKCLEELVDRPELREELDVYGISPSLPAGTEINGLHIEDGVAKIDFNSSFLNYDKEKERLILNSMLCTLKQFSSVDSLKILVEGSELEKFPGGTPARVALGQEYRVNMEVSEKLNEEGEEDYTEVTVFFLYRAPDGSNFYIPVTRVLEKQENELKASMQELLKGPRKRPGLFSNIPSDTSLLNLKVDEEGLAMVKFTNELMNFRGGKKGEELLVNQVVLTLAAHPLVEGVKLRLEEGEIDQLPYGTDLTSPHLPPSVLNYY